MEILILVLHVVAALGICGLVLLQHGKGADVGAAFGSGASGSLFGASGSANFLSRATAVLATLFMLSAFALGVIGRGDGGSVVSGMKAPDAPAKAPDLNLPPAPTTPPAGGATTPTTTPTPTKTPDAGKTPDASKPAADPKKPSGGRGGI